MSNPDNFLFLPAGVLEMSPARTAFIRSMEDAVLGTFRMWGYQEVRTPFLEYADTMSRGLANEELDMAFKLVDRGTGKMLLLSEKVKHSNARLQNALTDLHHAFKRQNGYADLEIAQKRSSLENTLIPESISDHTTRLRRAGFDVVTPWFQCFNFASLIALK